MKLWSVALLYAVVYSGLPIATGSGSFSSELDLDEITLFDANGAPVAYIAPDEELAIYLWNGKPVAYLEHDGDAFSIYGFNGKHLGWFDEGIVRDHRGDAVGFIEGALNKTTQIEPFKAFKQFQPLRAFTQIAPIRPIDSNRWSRMPLGLFLVAGRD